MDAYVHTQTIKIFNHWFHKTLTNPTIITVKTQILFYIALMAIVLTWIFNWFCIFNENGKEKGRKGERDKEEITCK